MAGRTSMSTMGPEEPGSRRRHEDSWSGRDKGRMESPWKRRRLGARRQDLGQQREVFRGPARDEAPRRQQFQWNKQLSSCDATVESILSLFSTNGHRFSARNLATAAHRVVKIAKRRQLLPGSRMCALGDACVKRIHDFDSRGLANLALSFAKADVEAPRLFAEIARVAATKLSSFNSQDMANTAWAFATAGIEAPKLFDAIADIAMAKLDDFNSQALANTAWAFACVRSSKLDFFTALLHRAMTYDLSVYDISGLRQLYFVDLNFRCTFPDRISPLAQFRDRMRAALREREPAPSSLKSHVAAVLNSIGWTHEFEYTTEEGLSITMAQPESKRAVEVDGPSQYLKGPNGNAGRHKNGSARFKSRLLRELGWTVIRVPYFEWAALGGSSTTECENYLLARLGPFS